MRSYNQLFIGGRWADSAGSEVIEVRSPHDRSLVGTVPHATPEDVDHAVAAARTAFDQGPWPRTAPEERRRTVARFQELYNARAAEFAALITAENGSPLTFTTGLNVHALPEQTAAYLRAAADLAWEEELPSGTLLRREAVGVVAAIIPWNAPHQSALVKMVPALLAGCTVVLKASPETAVDALALAEVVADAGFPDGVVSVLPAGRATSEYLVAHPGVDKVAFTGSTAAGRSIAATAGAQLKRVSLELGGKSAAIVLDDADPAAVARGLMHHSLGNNAQNCQAHTRILAPRSRYEEIVQAVRAMVESLVVGDPARPETFIGPMVRPDHQERVRSYIELGIAEGARLVTGGPEVPRGLEGGCYVTPTLFADVDSSLRVAREEIFGPVLVVIPFADDEDAVRIADDSDFGLGGGVWSADHERAVGIARRVRTGMMLVNGATPAFDGPFGGFKASGIGREFGAVGLGQYIEYKSIAL
ncbi:aldehyde dehydrogenase [Streptomyces bohaiensis]|uniref:Aldehyde dehydrogenase n=1 Tax=Streptomyces bohaiensis TaxID=1431344 RepID=A0ABX1CGV8_9ACTN|nr:aldehyde dehydrogenase [Streptomyces bohaiensis]NJQ17075.1 aldehyde dehydrogenase [Streptomyces bohaiensis]